MSAATAQETHDSLLGSGALTYPWWQDVQVTWDDTTWTCTLKAEDGESFRFGHVQVLNLAREMMVHYDRFDRQLVWAARDMLCHADALDMDAGVADDFLQYLVLGDVVYA